jgi:hypothetical protein
MWTVTEMACHCMTAAAAAAVVAFCGAQPQPVTQQAAVISSMSV